MADSSQRQEKYERLIGVLKRLIRIAVGDIRLSWIEFQTIIFEATNLCNEGPIGIDKKFQSDGSLQVLTQNCSIMGRVENGPIREDFLDNKLLKPECTQLVQDIAKHFWRLWTLEVTPDQLVRRKWHETGPNLQASDIVLVHDKSPTKGKYIMDIIDEYILTIGMKHS